MKKIPLIIDCDPGVDDALAIILAASKECFEIKAITSVAGNIQLEYTTRNLQLLKGLLKLSCDISKGAAKPLVKKQVVADKSIHGSDGFGGYAHLLNQNKLTNLSEISAIDLIAKKLRESKEKVVIAAIGPLTNIALFIKKYPNFLSKIAKFSIMGGGIDHGNITPEAEFNFFVDPEAADIVFNSGVPITLSTLDVTLNAFITQNDLDLFAKVDNTISDIALKILKVYACKDAALHDPVAILAISNPELFQTKNVNVQINISDTELRGKTILTENESNCCFIESIDRIAFIKEINKALGSYK